MFLLHFLPAAAADCPARVPAAVFDQKLKDVEKAIRDREPAQLRQTISKVARIDRLPQNNSAEVNGAQDEFPTLELPTLFSDMTLTGFPILGVEAAEGGVGRS